MYDNKLEERLEDLRFEKETCIVLIESLDEDDLCKSLTKEKSDAERKLKVIRNLIKALEIEDSIESEKRFRKPAHRSEQME